MDISQTHEEKMPLFHYEKKKESKTWLQHAVVSVCHAGFMGPALVPVCIFQKAVSAYIE